MEYKIESKDIVSVTGLTKTVDSISIRAISVDRNKEELNVSFHISFNGLTKDSNGNIEKDSTPPINLASSYMIRKIKNQLSGLNTNEEGLLIVEGNTRELTEEEKTLFESKESTARSQIYPLLAGLLVGTWQQSYNAASALASQYNYTLLPIEEQ